MSKQFWGVVIIIVLVFVGIFALTGNKSQTSSKSGSTSNATNHIEGEGKDKITLVEYGDYECPFCGQFYPVVKQVQSEFNSQIYFQFRNFPLVNVHQNAFAGARAAEAAAQQGKFWEMHDLLYEQNELYYNSNETAKTWINTTNPSTFFNQYAQQLGLNVAQFQKDYASNRVNDAINADMAEGNKLNVQATPTFYLDGKQIQVDQSAASFEKAIKAEVAKKTSTTAH